MVQDTDDSARRDVQISKALCYLLRHGAVKEKLPIDSNGYIPVNSLLSHNRLKTHKCTIDDLHRVVARNDKQRFHLQKRADGQEVLCATQGHSIKSVQPDKELLQKIDNVEDLPERLIHGTTVPKAIQVLKSGFLKKLSRNHVHLSPGITGIDSQVISGMRYSSTVYIHLKCNAELLQSITLYKSLNNVYLTSQDVPSTLFAKFDIREPTVIDPSKNNDTQELIQLLEKASIQYELKPFFA